MMRLGEINDPELIMMNNWSPKVLDRVVGTDTKDGIEYICITDIPLCQASCRLEILFKFWRKQWDHVIRKHLLSRR